MKSKFFPTFILFAITAVVLLIVSTQLLGFKANVSSAIAEFFIYGASYKFIISYIEKKDTKNDSDDGIFLFIKRYIIALVLMVATVSIIIWTIGYILNVSLEIKGMATYTAIGLGTILGFKFTNFFSKKLFDKKESEDEENLDLGENIEDDIAHIS